MLLYKVTPRRDSNVFHPTRFYRTRDFSSSTRRPQPGYIPDRLLYVGDFDEISIHLFPGIHRIRVRNSVSARRKLKSLGFETDPDKNCFIFVNSEDKGQIMEFQANVYVFEKRHFFKVPSNEYVSRQPVEAIGSESYAMPEIIRRWRMQLIWVPSVAELSGTLTDAAIIYSYQT